MAGRLYATRSEDSPEEWTDGFVEILLEAVHTNALAQGFSDESGPLGRVLVEDKELLDALERNKRKVNDVLSAWPEGLSFTVYALSNVVWQLRAWYTQRVGLLILDVLEMVSRQRNRLPPGPADPGLCVMKLLEGVALIETCRHSPERVREVLEALIRAKRLPNNVRLEAALVALYDGADGQIYRVPFPVPLGTTAGEKYLKDLAESLAPPAPVMESVARAKKAIEDAVDKVWPGVKPQYFGSGVNGFETCSSDVDCVVQVPLDPEDSLPDGEREGPSGAGGAGGMDRHKAKIAEAKAARKLAEALRTGENFGLEVKEVVETARVPLCKLQSKEGIAIDISFNNLLPLHNSRLLKAYSSYHPLVSPFGRLVKWWAKQRHVNDAMEGTLSSYSHILLVIHYLQRIGLVPNLQEKSTVDDETRGLVGEDHLHDGVHDVWFFDPSKKPDHRFNMEAPPPKEVTLRGLLCGFFRYFGYEFPFHSEVLSIRHPGGRVPKQEYFRDVFRLKAERVSQSLERLTSGDLPRDEPVELSPALDDHIWREESADTVEKAQGAESPPPPPMEEPAAPEAPEEVVEPVRKEEAAKRFKLPKEESVVQHDLSSRQTLCIDDPMELGRTLGTTFQGMERLCFENRRACELLSLGRDEESDNAQLDELFNGPPPERNVFELIRHRNFPPIFDERRRHSQPDRRGFPTRPPKRTVEMPIDRADITKLKGPGCKVIQELQSMDGMDFVSIKEDDPAGPKVVLRGAAAVVEQVIEKIELLRLKPQAEGPSRPTGSSSSTARGPLAGGNNDWPPDKQWHPTLEHNRQQGPGGTRAPGPGQAPRTRGEEYNELWPALDQRKGKGEGKRAGEGIAAQVQAGSFYPPGKGKGKDGGMAGPPKGMPKGGHDRPQGFLGEHRSPKLGPAQDPDDWGWAPAPAPAPAPPPARCQGQEQGMALLKALQPQREGRDDHSGYESSDAAGRGRSTSGGEILKMVQQPKREAWDDHHGYDGYEEAGKGKGGKGKGGYDHYGAPQRDKGAGQGSYFEREGGHMAYERQENPGRGHPPPDSIMRVWSSSTARQPQPPQISERTLNEEPPEPPPPPPGPPPEKRNKNKIQSWQ